jgi:hypothetical protein
MLKKKDFRTNSCRKNRRKIIVKNWNNFTKVTAILWSWMNSHSKMKNLTKPKKNTKESKNTVNLSKKSSNLESKASWTENQKKVLSMAVKSPKVKGDEELSKIAILRESTWERWLPLKKKLSHTKNKLAKDCSIYNTCILSQKDQKKKSKVLSQSPKSDLKPRSFGCKR